MRLFLAFILSFLTAFGPVVALAAATRTTQTQQGDGGGTIERNYIQNSNAIANTAGWVTYADGAAYVDGTGGVPTATWTRSTSSPIGGDANFVFTPGTLGDGVSYTIALDSKKKGMWIPISFDYQFTGTTPSDGDVQVMVYDVTNSQLIQPAPYKVPALVAGVNNTFVTGFQASSSSTSYRVSLYQSTSTSTYTMKGVNFRAGGTRPILGAAMSDWVVYTPTFGAGFGTVVTQAFSSRRLGDSLEVLGKFTMATTAASAATFTLGYAGVNANVNFDGTKASVSSVCGTAVSNQTATTTLFSYSVLLPATTGTNAIQFGQRSSTNVDSTVVNGSAWSNGTILEVHCVVPIVGWSSNVLLGSDADTRIVAAAYSASGAISWTATGGANFDTKIFDTHSAVTTGANAWVFTVPVPGKYKLSLTSTATTSTAAVAVFKTGSLYKYLFRFKSVSGDIESGSVEADCVAGDTLAVRLDTSTLTGDVSANGNNIYIEKVSGPNTIAASETVSGRYFAATATLTGSFSTVTYSTKDFDSHSAYSAGSLTIPTPGKYQFNAFIQFSAATLAAATNSSVGIFKNGTQMDQTNYVNTGTDSGNGVTLQVSDIINCVAGDVITVKALTGGTTPTVAVSNFANVFSWAKVAN